MNQKIVWEDAEQGVVVRFCEKTKYWDAHYVVDAAGGRHGLKIEYRTEEEAVRAAKKRVEWNKKPIPTDPTPIRGRELYAPGTIVKFQFWWYGRTNPHDGHRCRVVSSNVVVRSGRKYHDYVLEDLEELPPRAKRIFKMTDSSASCTGLTLPDGGGALVTKADYVEAGRSGVITDCPYSGQNTVSFCPQTSKNNV